MNGSWFARSLGTIAAVGALMLGSAGAVAAPADIGTYPAWATTGAGQFSGTFPAAAAFPNVTLVTDDAGATIASGKSAFLGATTGWGHVFGSSRIQPYITIASLGQVLASTSTVSFASATPVGWGFALGDVDADYVTISAVGPGGPLTSAQIGAQNTNNNPVLNYCQNASPKPGTCGSGTTFTDVPAWCPTGAVGVPCAGKPANSVVGHGVDTAGAYDWFIPTVPVTSMTLTFTPLSGLPSFQLWLVAPSPATSVSGAVALSSSPPPAGTEVELLDPAGVPVPDIEGDPVTGQLGPDGSFGFDTPNGDYQLAVVVPTGFTAPAPIPFTANGASLDLGTISIAAIPTVVPAANPELGPTGVDTAPLAVTGLSVVLVGLALLMLSRRLPNAIAAAGRVPDRGTRNAEDYRG